MLIITNISLICWALYFFAYVFIVIPIISSFFKINIIKITEINKNKTRIFNKYLLICIILSLGGLPPFLGFSIKLSAIIIRIKLFSLSILIILISSSLVSLFYYIKLFYNISISSTSEVKITVTHKTSPANKIIILSTLGNLTMSIIVLLI